MVRFTCVMVVAAAVLAILGCKGGRVTNAVPVSGLVTLDDQPEEGATVLFAPTGGGGSAASGTTDASGRFRLTTLDPNDGAIPGSYLVGVTKTEGKSIVEDVIKPGMTYDEQMKATMAARAKAGAKATAKFKELLPAKYANPGTSTFKADVVKGEKNEFKFPMTSK